MGDHHDHHEPVAGPSAGGWLVAGLAALAAIGMTLLVTQVGTSALALIGGVTFLVTGALCGIGGVELTLSEGEQTHNDDGHDGHGHH